MYLSFTTTMLLLLQVLIKTLKIHFKDPRWMLVTWLWLSIPLCTPILVGTRSISSRRRSKTRRGTTSIGFYLPTCWTLRFHYVLISETVYTTVWLYLHYTHTCVIVYGQDLTYELLTTVPLLIFLLHIWAIADLLSHLFFLIWQLKL